MNTDLPTDASKPTALDEIVRRATSLYSLPAVAAEVIELTNNPKVDVRALKDCIEVDPALTAKILRVVNSSLFGLSREVSDLNQAIALLGIKPLKLLVLGFSLPEELFCKVARQQLEWYWTTTLARAVAAREISEQLWQRSGDDAFLAGLLQGIGVLVLLGELQEPYARFLDRAIGQGVDLQRLEVDSLGFDHTTLSAALLEHWKMPELLVEAISQERDYRQLQRKKTPAAELARILHLAGLLAELIAQKRLNVLPDLLEAGDAYCGLDRQRLTEVVATLQPKVQQLADVLSLEQFETADYTAVLVEAHTRMSAIAEGVAEPLSRFSASRGEKCDEILADAAQLQKAVDTFLHRPTPPATAEGNADGKKPSKPEGPEPLCATEKGSLDLQALEFDTDFVNKLTFAVGQCRSRRQPLSVLLIEAVNENGKEACPEQFISRLLDGAFSSLELKDVILGATAPNYRILVLPGCERQEAVRHANAMFRILEEAFERLEATGRPQEYSVGAGVASVALPVKNFPPLDLIETAKRCLAAAQTNGSCVVKSLEVY